MRSSRKRSALAFAFALLTAMVCPSRADAQQRPQGFAVDRFYTSAPGGGWFVMDALDMRGGLGGAAGITMSYARNPLRVGVSDGSQHLTVVSDQAFADFGFAATYDRFRLYLNFDMPLAVKGNSGTIGDSSFTAPAVDAGSNPDSLSDVRIGFDTRLFGSATGPFRIGVGAQLFVPNAYNDTRANYDTDGTYRAMGRLLFAGDVRKFMYAGHLGVHARPLDDSPAPPSPQGHELLFGVAAGPKILVGARGTVAIIVGPEIYGATALKSFLSTNATALEGLLSARLESTGDNGPQWRVKLGVGGGLNPRFGAPEWRGAIGFEMFGHVGDTDKHTDKEPGTPAEE